MKTTITTLALALIAVCGFAVESATAGDQENIQGTWTLETASIDGNAMPRVTVLYVFTGETLIVRPEAGKEQKATFTLDLTSKPKVIVVQHDQHLPDAKPDRTPYELDGDTLKIAFTSPDERPTEVSDKGHVLFTLKRKK
ncbi:MAG TPA: TIGR03067 domain-containing protein [Chthoniobacterales bacterium]